MVTGAAPALMGRTERLLHFCPFDLAPRRSALEQDRLAEIGSPEIGPAEVSAGEVGPLQIGRSEVGLAQIGMGQLGRSQCDPGQLGRVQVGPVQIRAGQFDPGHRAFARFAMKRWRTAKIDAGQASGGRSAPVGWPRAGRAGSTWPAQVHLTQVDRPRGGRRRVRPRQMPSPRRPAAHSVPPLTSSLSR